MTKRTIEDRRCWPGAKIVPPHRGSHMLSPKTSGVMVFKRQPLLRICGPSTFGSHLQQHKSTNVSAARYLCIRFLFHHATGIRSATVVAVELSSRRRFAERYFFRSHKDC